jgi:hypothetical protein
MDGRVVALETIQHPVGLEDAKEELQDDIQKHSAEVRVKQEALRLEMKKDVSGLHSKLDTIQATNATQTATILTAITNNK